MRVRPLALFLQSSSLLLHCTPLPIRIQLLLSLRPINMPKTPTKRVSCNCSKCRGKTVTEATARKHTRKLQAEALQWQPRRPSSLAFLVSYYAAQREYAQNKESGSQPPVRDAPSRRSRQPRGKRAQTKSAQEDKTGVGRMHCILYPW